MYNLCCDNDLQNKQRNRVGESAIFLKVMVLKGVNKSFLCPSLLTRRLDCTFCFQCIREQLHRGVVTHKHTCSVLWVCELAFWQ